MSDTPPPSTQVNFAEAEKRHERVRVLGGGLALILLVFFAYWPSLRGGFVWDDLVLVAKNPLVTGELNLQTVWLRGDFSLSTVATYGEWLAFGERPAGYRVVNVLLHLLSATILWRLLLRLKIPGAWLGAALFAFHPMATASVAWISELKNTLSLPFYLMSGHAFLGFRAQSQTGGRRKAWMYYAISLLTFGLALLAKTSTVMLPLLLLATIWWQNNKITKPDLLQVTPHFGLAGIFGAMTIWYQSQQAIRGVIVQSGNFWERLTDAGTAVWFYLGKILLPLNLCAIYPSWDTTIPKATKFLPLVILLAGFVVAWRFRHGWGKPVGFALACFSAALFPVLGFFDMYFMIFARVSDHFVYVPLIAITALVAAGVSKIPNKQAATTTALVLLAGLTALTWQRAKVYASDEALWRDTVAKNPRAWNAHNNLACNLAERGQLDKAMQHFEISLSLNPTNAEAHRNLGRALMIKGRATEGESHLQSAFKLKPEDPETLTSLATALVENRQLAQAIELLRKAISIKPEIKTRLQLGPLLAATGDYAAAIAEFQAVCVAQPDSVEALNDLAWIRATCPEDSLRNGTEAVRLGQEACRITKQQPIPLGTLAAAYAETGDFTNAVNTAQMAIELATASGDERFAEMNRQLQRLYRSGRAFRTTRGN